MWIFEFFNTNTPIGMKSIENGDKLTSLRLFKLPIYTEPKYSIDQIRDFR